MFAVVFGLSFMLGDQRTIKDFGLGLAAAVLLDALIVRCVLLPATLELLGERTWAPPSWLQTRLPKINIEGTAARNQTAPTDPHPTPRPQPTPTKT
jgi:putative drug exporter of the RND superfamily